MSIFQLVDQKLESDRCCIMFDKLEIILTTEDYWWQILGGVTLAIFSYDDAEVSNFFIY